MDIVLSTNNQHKLREFSQMLAGSGVNVISLANFENVPEVVEDGDTFSANALKKAWAIARHTGRITVADDSGLEVDAIDGRPGIYSARYAGEEADDGKNIEKLLSELEGLSSEKRGAQFRCVIAVVDPERGIEQVVEGICRGVIAEQVRGEQGFGYDPVFLDEASGLTFAEMDADQKNAVSHRSRAIGEFKQILPGFLSNK